MLHTPNGLIVPGGRFREMYYWVGAASAAVPPSSASPAPVCSPLLDTFQDTFFILLGLLRSGMSQTAKGILENMLHLVEEYGFVPNGARLWCARWRTAVSPAFSRLHPLCLLGPGLRAYYLTRSQPPLLTAMVDLYVNTTGVRFQRLVPFPPCASLPFSVCCVPLAMAANLLPYPSQRTLPSWRRRFPRC